MSRLQDNSSRSSGSRHRITAPRENHVRPSRSLHAGVMAGFMRCTICKNRDLCQAVMGALRGSRPPNPAAIATTLQVRDPNTRRWHHNLTDSDGTRSMDVAMSPAATAACLDRIMASTDPRPNP